MQRLLVPVDFDAGSRRALEHALELADRLSAVVDVVHVWEPPALVRPDLMVYLDSVERAVSLSELTQNQARASLAQLLAELPERRTRPRALVLLGSPAQQIVETAREGAYDLIVMGTRARHGVERILFGSVAAKVVRLASCPVLIVPPSTHDDTRAA